MSKIRIGFHVNAVAIGGSDLYLSQIIKNLDREKYEPVLFCRRVYPVDELGYPSDIKVVYFDQPKLSHKSQVTSHKEDQEPGQHSDPDPGAGRYALRTFQGRSLRPEDFSGPVANKSWIIDIKLFIGLCREVLRYRKLLKKYWLDIFHSNDGGPEPMVIAARLAGIKHVIASYCVLPDPEGQVRPGDRTRKLFEQGAVRCVNKAIVKSQATKELWVKRLKVNEDKFVVIYNGINPERFNVNQDRERNREELGAKPDARIVGVTARLHPMKGHRYLIEAMPGIIAKHPQVEFWFVGEGGLRQDLERQAARLGVRDHVKFLGFRKDVDKLTACYDIAVLPSVSYETFGSSLIEAMVFGIPVVASNFSGIPEVVDDGKNGILASPTDSHALQQAICRLLEDNPLRHQMGEAAREKVHMNFSQERMLRETLGLYEKLLKKARK